MIKQSSIDEARRVSEANAAAEEEARRPKPVTLEPREVMFVLAAFGVVERMSSLTSDEWRIIEKLKASRGY